MDRQWFTLNSQNKQGWTYFKNCIFVRHYSCRHRENKICQTSSLRSKRFRASSSRKLGREQKKEWRGRGRGKKEPLARKPHDFEKLRSPTNAASDWCGASSVDCLALETSIKPGMLCLRASQIWSHLICGRRLQMLWTDIYFNRVCAKVYEIIVFKVYLEIEQWRLGKANLLGMTACGSDLKKTNVLFVGDNINVNQNISTQH